MNVGNAKFVNRVAEVTRYPLFVTRDSACRVHFANGLKHASTLFVRLRIGLYVSFSMND